MFHVTWKDYVMKGLCEFMDGRFSLYVCTHAAKFGSRRNCGSIYI